MSAANPTFTEASSDWRHEITTLEREANDAFLRRDIATLDRLFSDAFVVNSPINRVNDKRKVLELLAAGVISHVSCEVEHEFMRQDGDLIIVMGSDTFRNAAADPLLRRRVTNVSRKEAAGWRLYVRHATIVGPVQQA